MVRNFSYLMSIYFFSLARDSAKHEVIVHLLEIRQEHDRRNLARDINDFRATYQQSKNAREYDLNDLSTSIIVCNSTSKCGPGSCLYFQGEDQNKQHRDRKQKEQMNRWITEQVSLDISRLTSRKGNFSSVPSKR
jgi:hypothetical protein